MSKMIIESRCRLCGAMVTETATVEESPVASRTFKQDYFLHRLMRKNLTFCTHDCGRGRTGILEVIGMFPADEPEEKEEQHERTN